MFFKPKRTAASSGPATVIIEGPGKENRPQHPLATMITPHEPLKGPASLFAGKVVENTQRQPIKGLAGRDAGRLVEAGAMNRAFEKMLVSLTTRGCFNLRESAARSQRRYFHYVG